MTEPLPPPIFAHGHTWRPYLTKSGATAWATFMHQRQAGPNRDGRGYWATFEGRPWRAFFILWPKRFRTLDAAMSAAARL